MVGTSPKFPWVLLSLLLGIGALAILSVVSRLNDQSMPGWGIVVAILFGTFFVTWTWALFVYLRWRDRRSLATGVTATDCEALKGTVYGLVQGAEYQVMQTFTDYYKNEFHRGELLRFKERHFLPYHGGHTIIFEQRQLYLQDEENVEILAKFSQYIAPVDN